MSLMGTLAKVAIGYAAARGIDKMRGGGGPGALFGGTQVPAGQAKAGQMPGMDQVQAMLGGLGGGAGGLQQMMSRMMQGGGMDLGGLAGEQDGQKGGLLSSVPGGGAGIAGMLAALGGAAAMTGQNVGKMIDAGPQEATSPDAEKSAALFLRAMIQAAKSDGEIDAQEQAKIMETVGDADAEDIAFVQAQLAAPLDVASLAADTPEAMAPQVYSMSLMTIRLDSPAEAEYLDQLASALGLTQQTVNALHLQMGVQPLYS